MHPAPTKWHISNEFSSDLIIWFLCKFVLLNDNFVSGLK